ncbi:MAG: AIR synthase-related protein, partial [Candidatus Heimdallarchaeota archaeon]
MHKSNDGKVPKTDFVKAKTILTKVVDTISDGLATACHDISKGGLFVALVEMAMAGDLGFDVNTLRIPSESKREDLKLFSESTGRFLMTCTTDNLEKIIAKFASVEIPATLIGEVTEEKKIIVKNTEKTLIDLPLDE